MGTQRPTGRGKGRGNGRARGRKPARGAARPGLALAALLAVFVPVFLPVTPPAAAADEVVLVVDGERHVFSAEIADDPVERSRGLMFRESIPTDHGMLFDFGVERHVTFWMKNTLISLDIIFVEADGDIVAVAEETTPLSLDSIPSDAPVRFVFEVIAGTVDRLGLEPGDRLDHPRVVSP